MHEGITLFAHYNGVLVETGSWKNHKKLYILTILYRYYFIFYFCTIRKKFVNLIRTLLLSLFCVLVLRRRFLDRTYTIVCNPAFENSFSFFCSFKNHSVCSGDLAWKFSSLLSSINSLSSLLSSISLLFTSALAWISVTVSSGVGSWKW